MHYLQPHAGSKYPTSSPTARKVRVVQLRYINLNNCPKNIPPPDIKSTCRWARHSGLFSLFLLLNNHLSTWAWLIGSKLYSVMSVQRKFGMKIAWHSNQLYIKLWACLISTRILIFMSGCNCQEILICKRILMLLNSVICITSFIHVDSSIKLHLLCIAVHETHLL